MINTDDFSLRGAQSSQQSGETHGKRLQSLFSQKERTGLADGQPHSGEHLEQSRTDRKVAGNSAVGFSNKNVRAVGCTCSREQMVAQTSCLSHELWIESNPVPAPVANETKRISLSKVQRLSIRQAKFCKKLRTAGGCGRLGMIGKPYPARIIGESAFKQIAG